MSDLDDLIDLARKLREITRDGDGWLWELKVLRDCHDYHLAQLGLTPGDRYMIADGYEHWHSEPGLKPGRCVTLRRIEWTPKGERWRCIVYPDREWWWKAFATTYDGPPKEGDVWVQVKPEDRHVHGVPPEALVPIPADHVEPPWPTEPPKKQAVRR